ncbi:hypothetical protein [Longispora urticae]
MTATEAPPEAAAPEPTPETGDALLEPEGVAGQVSSAGTHPSDYSVHASDAANSLGLPRASAARSQLAVGDQEISASSIGEVTLGGKNVYIGGTHVFDPLSHRVPIPEEDLHKAQHAFVEPEGFRALGPMLSRHRVLVLRTRPGHGGGTAAMRLLHDAEAGRFLQFPAEIDLRRFGADEVEERTGYLVRNVTNTSRLTELELRRLDGILGQRGSWLVVTVETHARLPDAVLAEFVADLGAPPPAETVFATHLRYLMGPTGSQTAEAVLGDPDVIELLRASSDARIARAADLARMFDDASQDPDFSVVEVRDRFRRLTEESFDAWFDNLPDLATRTLVIAAAVLHGGSRESGFAYETVADAADDLRERLLPPPEDDKPAPREDPFARRRTELLNDALARLVSTTHRTPYGWAPVDVVRFIDPSWPQRVLHRTWHEYGGARRDLLRWLCELAVHPATAVRVHAATAVGFLSRYSFDYVRSTVLEPWADSDVLRNREAAAIAVGIPGVEPALAVPVRRMVDQWSRADSTSARRYTAALAYGSGLGLRDPDRALRVLSELAGRVDRQLLFAIRDSLGELVIHGGDDVALNVLSAMHRWALTGEQGPPVDERDTTSAPRRSRSEENQRNKVRRYTGFFAFLGLSSTLVTREAVDGRPDGPVWPGLLWMANRGLGTEGATEAEQETARLVAALWRGALTSPVVNEGAKNALTRWARRVNADASGTAALGRLAVAAVDGHTRTRDIVRLLAGEWTNSDDGPAPGSAEAVLKAL